MSKRECAECGWRDGAHTEWCPIVTPCNMQVEPPFPFAECLNHDETFPLGGLCKFHDAGKVRCCEGERCAAADHPEGGA